MTHATQNVLTNYILQIISYRLYPTDYIYK